MDSRRAAAVQRGMAFMFKHLQRDGHLYLLGAQCVGMFFDIYLSETDGGVCEAARQYCLVLLSQLEEHIAALEKKVNYESAQTREIWRK